MLVSCELPARNLEAEQAQSLAMLQSNAPIKPLGPPSSHLGRLQLRILLLGPSLGMPAREVIHGCLAACSSTELEMARPVSSTLFFLF